jgi:hypothetical protein
LDVGLQVESVIKEKKVEHFDDVATPKSVSYPKVQGAISLGVKRLGSEDVHSRTSAEVKNGGTIPPFPSISSWHCTQLIKYRDNFSFVNE